MSPIASSIRLRSLSAAGLVLLSILSALGCGKSADLTVDVRDGANHPIAGIEIRQVGNDKRLGVTGADGRATISPAVSGEAVQVRLAADAGAPAAEGLLLQNPYTIDGDALKRGYKLFRLDRGAASPVDSTATLEVLSVPPGARVLLGGTPRGATPATLDSLAPGPVTLELQLDGWHTHRVDLYLTPGQNSYTHELTREEVTTASLQVLSDPPGAAVSLNGKASGKTTPASFPSLPAGTYRVRVTRSGYRAWETRLDLEPGRKGVADAGLLVSAAPAPTASESHAAAEPPSGRADTPPPPPSNFRRTYSVSTAPGFTEVYVDGEDINRNQTGNFKITLNAGDHRFRLKNENAGIDMVLRYSVKPGDANNVLILNYESRKVAARNDSRAGR